MTKEVDEALEQLHAFLKSIEKLYDADLLRMTIEALAPTHIILKESQEIDQQKADKNSHHLRLV